jgi:hypothetical protein
MSNKTLSPAVVLICAMVLLATESPAQEQSIQKKDVPAAILETFQKSYPKAAIKGCSKEMEQGNMTYEIESVEGKVHRDVTFSADGSLISIEESLPYAQLPEPVRNAITKEYPKAKVSLCERVIKGDATQFEVLVVSGKQKYELVLSADGTIVKTEKK